jgi:hypothetical protein
MNERELTGKEILVTPQTVVCASHGEHFRARWPTGWAVFALSMLQAALDSPELQKATRLAGHRIGKPRAEDINKVLAKRPTCYFVDRDTIRDALIAAGLLAKQRCDMCGVVRLAGNYDIGGLPIVGDGRRTMTVCVECCLDGGEREHAAYPKGPPPRG